MPVIGNPATEPSGKRPYVAYNPEVVAHLANGNHALLQAGWYGGTPNDRMLQATLAAAEFAAATAKATVAAIFDTDVNAAVEGLMIERAERRREARERTGR